jgi:hypothetical protein
MQKMFYASLGCYICLGLMFLPRVYLAGNTLATVSAEPLNKFGLFDVLSFIDGDLYALVCQKVELAQYLSYQLPLVC